MLPTTTYTITKEIPIKTGHVPSNNWTTFLDHLMSPSLPLCRLFILPGIHAFLVKALWVDHSLCVFIRLRGHPAGEQEQGFCGQINQADATHSVPFTKPQNQQTEGSDRSCHQETCLTVFPF